MLNETAAKNGLVKIRRTFEPGFYNRHGRYIFLKNPTLEELGFLHELTRQKLGPVAPLEVVQKIYRHNTDSFWAIWRSPSDSRENAKLIGYYGLLLLNERGVDALQQGKLNAADPDLSLIVGPKERPAGNYIWAVVAPGCMMAAGDLLFHALGDEIYKGVPYYGTVSTWAGARAIQNNGFTNGELPKLGSIVRIDETPDARARRLNMEVRAGRRSHAALKAIACSTQDEVSRALAVRAAVFMIEQKCPYPEEFDGNDFCGTHILGTVDGEPAAAMRVRYFADFAKLERLSVLPRFRRTLIALEVVEKAVDLCRRKGYRKVYGHAQKHLVHFWQRFGFQPLQKNRKVVFSDHEYVEMWGVLAPHPDAITMDSDPMVIIRPEGQWDEPGVLDKSAERPPTNPH